VKRHTLVHAAIYLQLAWFSSELVLASTAVALAPRIMGKLTVTFCVIYLYITVRPWRSYVARIMGQVLHQHCTLPNYVHWQHSQGEAVKALLMVWQAGLGCIVAQHHALQLAYILHTVSFVLVRALHTC